MPIRWTDTTAPDPLPLLPGRADLIDVWVAPEVDTTVKTHLASASVELGGLLVGIAHARTLEGQPVVTHLSLLKAIPAEQSEGTSVSLKMGTAVWTAAQHALAPGERIIGWYHSHPGLSAFFSETDRQTQRAFFSHAFSVGWVIDPWTGDEAFFVGPDCTPVNRGPDARPAHPTSAARND